MNLYENDGKKNLYPTKSQSFLLNQLATHFQVPSFNIQLYDEYSWNDFIQYKTKIKKLRSYADSLGLFRVPKRPVFKVHQIYNDAIVLRDIYHQKELIDFFQQL